MSSIFGIWGQYTEFDVESMRLLLRFRSTSELTHFYSFEAGFIAESNAQSSYPDSSFDRSKIPAVIDGYIGSSITSNPGSELNNLVDSLSQNPRQFDTLCGSFALAAYCSSQNQLVLIRDHVGSRPLYYTHFGSTFVFASSPKAVLSGSHLVTEINPDAISLFLSLIAVPDPNSIFQGIHALRPGHFLTFSGDSVSVHRYWNPIWSQIGDPPEDETELANKLRSALECSVRDAYSSSLPEKRCFFLSGGTDTTAVVGLAAKAGCTPIHTFTIGYEGQGSGYENYNEFEHAKRISDRYKTTHHEMVISPSDVRKSLPAIIAYMDQPSGDAINSFLVSHTIPEEFDTVLTGTGGDEIFVGSHWYLQRQILAERIAKWQKIPDLVRSLVQSTNRFIPIHTIRHRLEMLEEVSASIRGQYHHLKFVFKRHDRQHLFTPHFESLLGARSNPDAIVSMYDANHDRLDETNRYLALLLQNEVSNLQLRDLDSMCHANHLESRSPLLDQRVLTVLQKIPGSLKIKGGTLRYMMFKALSDIIPIETQTRKKMSFIVPMDLWARRDLRDIIDNVLSKESVTRRNIFNPDAIARIYSDFFQSGKERHPFKIWMLAVFELWCRFHIDQPLGASVPERIEDLL